jgi:hypothetical protein
MTHFFHEMGQTQNTAAVLEAKISCGGIYNLQTCSKTTKIFTCLKSPVNILFSVLNLKESEIKLQLTP